MYALRIRALNPDRELDAFLAVRDQGLPYPPGAEAWRTQERSGAGTFRSHLLGERPGRIVAAASITDSPMLADGVTVRLTVDREHRRRGHGRALARAIDDLLAERRPHVIDARVIGTDEASRAWAERRGFTVKDHGIRSRLEVANFDFERHRARVERARADGLAFEQPTDLEQLYQLYARLIGDVPDRVEPPSQEHFRRLIAPARAVSLIVRDGEEWVGLTLMTPADPDGAWVFFTGVATAYRQRGLGTALKALAMDQAFHAGYRWIETNNNAVNAPILAANSALGFKRVADTLFMRKRLLR